MFSTLGMTELQNLLSVSLSDPHHALGMHEITTDDKGERCLVVRAFIPGAKKIEVLDPEDPDYRAELKEIHFDGLFESVIPDRKEWFRYLLRIHDAAGNCWTTRDPYSFMPVLSEYDLYLFGRGTHYKIYEKLGAMPMTVDGADGVLFSVWAPNAKRVSVVGSFNNWDGRRGMMRLLAGSGVWELFVPGIQKYDKYKFEIKTPYGDLIEKTDPYGHFFELRPSASALVYDIEGYVWGDGEWIKKRTENNPLNGPMNIYEVHLGSWRKRENGEFLSYPEIADKLVGYVKEMGYTHIELMPVTEYPFDGSWGYQVTGYYAPTSRYGNPHEFMAFVDKFHQNGIGVIMDWVPAHFPKDAFALGRFDGTALYEHENTQLGEHPDWGTLIFNYGRNEVSNFLIGSALFWLEKYHIDGFRVDAVASMLYLDYGKRAFNWSPNMYGGRENLEAVEFIKHMNSVVLKEFPNVLMIAEESTSWANVSRPAEHGGLGFNLKWNMGWMNDFLSYVAKDPIYRKYWHNNLTFGMMYAYSENFVLVLSHDEVVHMKGSLIGKMPGDLWKKCANLRLALGFMYGHPGKKLLFMGGEFGQFDEWSEKRELCWHLLEYPHHRQLRDFAKDLNHLYLKEKAFWYDDFGGGGFEWIDCDDRNRSLLSFIRKSDDPADTLVIVCNFTPNPVNGYWIGVPYDTAYIEVLNSDDVKYGGSGVVNSRVLKSENGACNGRERHIVVDVPPLGMALFKSLPN